MVDFDSRELIKILEKGGVILHPTDTCYGLTADIFNEVAINKIYQIKGRDFNKPVSIMVFSIEEARKYGEFNKKAESMVRSGWPGALTIVVPRKKELPAFLNANSDLIGIRMPDDIFCLDLLRKFGCPLITTSANSSGDDNPYSVESVNLSLKERFELIDSIVDRGAIPEKPVSIVVKIKGDEIEILRG